MAVLPNATGFMPMQRGAPPDFAKAARDEEEMRILQQLAGQRRLETMGKGVGELYGAYSEATDSSPLADAIRKFTGRGGPGGGPGAGVSTADTITGSRPVMPNAASDLTGARPDLIKPPPTTIGGPSMKTAGVDPVSTAALAAVNPALTAARGGNASEIGASAADSALRAGVVAGGTAMGGPVGGLAGAAALSLYDMLFA